MLLYTVRRIALALPTLLVTLVLLAFLSLQVLADPIDTSAELAGPSLGPPGSNDGAFSTWLSALLRGDLGLSLRTNQPVSEIIAKRYPITLELLLLSIIVAYVIALPISFFLSRKQVSLDHSIARLLGLFALSLPAVCVAVAVLAWSFSKPTVPIGFIELGQDLAGNLRSLLLPVLTLALPFAAIQIPNIHAIRMGEMASQARLPMGGPADQAQYASSRRGMPYAFLPVLSNLGLQVGMLLGALIVIETIFNLPGLGYILVQTSFNRDMPLLLGIVCVFLVLSVLLTAGIYLLYALIDLISSYSRPASTTTPLQMAARFAKVHRFWLSGLILACLLTLMWVFVTSAGSGQDSLGLSMTERLQPPSGDHWLGTDELGRDRFAQFLSGARISFTISLLGMGLALLLGSTLGALAGALGGMFNRILIGLSELILAIPALMLGLVLLINNPGSTSRLALSIALVTIPLFARTTSATIEQLKAEWISPQVKPGRIIMGRLILPILAQACFVFVIALSIETTLSFLGVSSQPPELSLGALLNNGLRFARDTPSGLVVPALSIVFVSFLFMLLSDALNRLAAQFSLASSE